MALLGVNLKPTDFKPEIYHYIEGKYKRTGNPLLKMMLDQPDIELESLKNICIPVLVVAAENDLYDQKLFEDITETLPDATLKIMRGHDHGNYILNKDILYPELENFFSDNQHQ